MQKLQKLKSWKQPNSGIVYDDDQRSLARLQGVYRILEGEQIH